MEIRQFQSSNRRARFNNLTLNVKGLVPPWSLTSSSGFLLGKGPGMVELLAVKKTTTFPIRSGCDPQALRFDAGVGPKHGTTPRR
jgi:hypothetical protein